MPPTYEDCTLEISEKRGKGYPMLMIGPAGRQTGTLHISPASASLRACLSRLKSFATDEEFLRQFGFALYSALFPARMLSAWRKHRQKLGDEAHLRLKLIIQPPEIASVPWELMCDEDGIPFATSTPLVRFQEHPESSRLLTVRPPLRVLVSIASPRDQSPLSSLKEKERIEQTLAPLVARGLVHLTVSEKASGLGLLDDLRRGVHIWHFIGHGVFNALTANGSLAFENESGDTDLIDAKRLRILLEQSPVRLAILNACETGRFSLDPLLGIAPALVRAGVPAVIAMQFAFPDASAVEFSSMFYRALADGYPVDACVSEGRKAVITRLGLGQPDWAIPVLYMRSPDGRLFIQDRPTEQETLGAGDDAPSIIPGIGDLRYLDAAALHRLLAHLASSAQGTPPPHLRGADNGASGDEHAVLRQHALAVRREIVNRRCCHVV